MFPSFQLTLMPQSVSHRILRGVATQGRVCAACLNAGVGGFRSRSTAVTRTTGGQVHLSTSASVPSSWEQRRYSTTAAEGPATTAPVSYVLDVLRSRHLLQATTSSALRQHLGICRESTSSTLGRSWEDGRVMKAGEPGHRTADKSTNESRRASNLSVQEEEEDIWTRRTIYAGIDPSADSLHVGNLIPLMALLWLAMEGHKVVVIVSKSGEKGAAKRCLHYKTALHAVSSLYTLTLCASCTLQIGEATGSIGDPSGRSSERNALSWTELDHNVQRITQQVRDFFENAGQILLGRHEGRLSSSSSHSSENASSVSHFPEQEAWALNTHIIGNAGWYEKMNVLEFLGKVGRHARVGTMMARDSVKSRLFAPAAAQDTKGQQVSPVGMSFTEFSYQLLQAYDFYFLYEHNSCTVQVGGSDQMGNIMAGVDLIRRFNAEKIGRPIQTEDIDPSNDADSPSSTSSSMPAYGLTVPLLTTSSGAKFGKSAGNAVWLDQARMSDLDFYQYFLRTADADVNLYLCTLTLAPIAHIEALLEKHSQQPQLRMAQSFLADEVIRLVRGEESLRRAQHASYLLFECRLEEATTSEVISALHGDPRLRTLSASSVLGSDEGSEMTLLSLAHEAGLGTSKSDLRRLMANGGLYLNDQQIRENRPISKSDLQGKDSSMLALRAGKADYRIVLLSDKAKI